LILIFNFGSSGTGVAAAEVQMYIALYIEDERTRHCCWFCGCIELFSRSLTDLALILSKLVLSEILLGECILTTGVAAAELHIN
jgi:hypothetical protein